MKKNLTLAILITSCFVTATLTSCKKGCTDPNAINYNEKAKKDDPDNPCEYPEEEENFIISENITTNTTWTTGNVYTLTTRIVVTNGTTLTIEPGVIIKSEVGQGANATALIIARGAKINAFGTAAQPIIFTSITDQIQPGQIASPNLSIDTNGLWGGLIILGNAPISAASGTEAQIEGIPTSETNGLYGGTDETDNSGVLQYVSIRHGGSFIVDGDEINGLTLGGVGSGTIINHIEIVSNQDDGLACFGGTVNVSNILVLNAGDDGLDTDQAYAGTISNFIVYDAGDAALELDGPEGADLGQGNHKCMNGSIYVENGSELCDTDANTNVDFEGVFWFGMSTGDYLNGIVFTELPTASITAPVFSDLQADIPAGEVVTDYFLAGSDAAVTATAVGSQTVGADKLVFTGWTWTAIHSNNYLSAF